MKSPAEFPKQVHQSHQVISQDIPSPKTQLPPRASAEKPAKQFFDYFIHYSATRGAFEAVFYCGLASGCCKNATLRQVYKRIWHNL
jgi:hypothetical protein